MPRSLTLNPADFLRRSAVVFLLASFAGCSEEGENAPQADAAPVIATFTSDRSSAAIGESISFAIDATDDIGLDSAVISYGDGTRTLLPVRGRKRLSATVARYYASPGLYKPILTVYDTRVQSDSQSLAVVINAF